MSAALQLERCALSAQEEKAWQMTRAAVQWVCPAFTFIMMKMLHKAGSRYVAVFTRDKRIPIAATDGDSLILNPDGFFKLNLQERIFVVCHEIFHCMWAHCAMGYHWRKKKVVRYLDGTELPYDHESMNKAQDYVVNDALIVSKIGEFPKCGLHDTDIATHRDSTVDAYRKVYKRKPPGRPGKPGDGAGEGGQPGNQPGDGHGGFDVHLEPGTSTGNDPAKAVDARNEAEWGVAINAALNLAKAMGKLPAALARAFEEMVTPQVAWQDHVRGLFARKVGSSAYDWYRADEELMHRGIYVPARSGHGADTVVVAGDTSGSVGPKDVDLFFGEMAGLLADVKPRKLIVMWCDAKVHRVDELYDELDLNHTRYLGAPGGGGTSFVPVFDQIHELGLRPDALIYLTDMCGTFPDAAPSYPVIWGSILPDMQAPFGDVVSVPRQAA
jgi:predicted metal-dependent peptidase